MKVEIEIQRDGANTIYEYINNQLAKSPKKAYFFCGCVKEQGFNILEESIIDIKTKVIFVVGIDKKNTTKNMLELLLKYTDGVYIYNNNDMYEFDSNTVIFEYAEKVVMLTANSNVSEGGLKDNVSFYTTIEYDLTNKEEKESYKETIKKLLSQIEGNGFQKLAKDGVEKLLDDKQIFSIKQYIHNVKSISELLEERKSNSTSSVKEEKNDTEDDIIGAAGVIPKVDLSDNSLNMLEIEFSDDTETIEEKKEEEKPVLKAKSKSKSKHKNEDIEIKDDIADTEIPIDEGNIKEEKEEKFYDFADEKNNEIDKNSELYDEELENIDFDENATLDIENMLFSRSDLKLTPSENRSNIKKDIKVEDKKENEKVQTKKLDLNNISNLLIELPDRPIKDQEAIAIKVPNYVKDMVPSFFEMNDSAKNTEINGVMAKVRDIKIEIVDVKTSQKYMDRDAKIIQKNGQTSISITSDMLKNVSYTDKDIVRIIKLSSDVYHVEFISKEIQEYKLWSKLCTQTLKSTSRKYGMM